LNCPLHVNSPTNEATRDDFIPIPGTKRIKYLEENVAAADVKLSSEEETDIRKAIERVGGSKGARYPPAMMARLFGDSPPLKK
jgi:diketogulonate reductase-like aldo/keto reductase